MNYNEQTYLQVPDQTLTRLTFCKANSRQFKAWVSNLPMINLGEISKKTYHAIIEFNQLIISPQLRFELLEILRPCIHYICDQLNQRYIEQGVLLDDQQKKIANLSQALQTHLAIGYKILIKYHSSKKSRLPKQLLALAIQRTLTELLFSLLRTYQLYLHTPKGLWREIHHLYHIATLANLEHQVIKDTHDAVTTIERSYVQIILLGCCQPNQLLKKELTLVVEKLNSWSINLQVDKTANDQSVLIIPPKSDICPQFRHLTDRSSLLNSLGINTLPLIRLLHNDHKTLIEQSGAPKLIDSDFNIDLLEHLIQSWGGMKQRNFSRTPASYEVEIAIGLSAVHFHLSGKVNFDDMLKPPHPIPKRNPLLNIPDFLPQVDSSLDLSVDEDGFSFDSVAIKANFAQTKQDEDRYPSCQGQLLNLSPRGYCIQWHHTLAPNLKTGEVISIKEYNAEHWGLGIVRWMRLAKDFGTQIGVELISPNSLPCGVQLITKKTENNPFQRALYIPEIKTIGQEPSVLVSHMPFKEGQKILINMKGNLEKHLLNKKIMSTNSICQFSVKQIMKPKIEKDLSRSPLDEPSQFESLWKEL